MSQSPGIPPPEQPPLISRISRHPLAAVFMGFMLTGVIGTMMTNYLTTARQHEAEMTRLRDTRRQAVLEMSRLLSERLLRMEMMVQAIQRHASPEVIAEYKKNLDETEARWFTKRPEILILSREVLGESDYEAFRTDLENRFSRKRLIPLRDTINKACAAITEGRDGAEVLKEIQLDQTLKEMRNGMEAFTDGLYDLASIPLENVSEAHAAQLRKRVRQRIEEACP